MAMNLFKMVKRACALADQVAREAQELAQALEDKQLIVAKKEVPQSQATGYNDTQPLTAECRRDRSRTPQPH